MNRIDTLFQELRSQKRTAFMPFLTAGDPDLAFTQDAIRVAADAGASMLEIGFPFSDPIADGPVIQASYTRALRHKLKLSAIFAALKQVAADAPPMVAMASYSLIWKKGIDAFLDAAIDTGLSGAVVPDLPAEEADELSKRCAERDFKLILLVTPTTSQQRAELIVKACSGFVYVVSVVGITGERATISDQVGGLLERLRTMTDLPLCVGFGVSQKKHVEELKSIADGIIVGSAFVKKLELAQRDRDDALNELRVLIQELNQPLI